LEVRTLTGPLGVSARRAALFSLLAALVAGCSASNAPALAPGSIAAQSNGFARPAGTTTPARGWISPGAKADQHPFYWGNFSTSTITIYTLGAKPKEIGQITDGIDEPERLFVDRSRNLWVTNLGNDTLTEYPPGKTKPSFTISTDVANPIGIVVDSAGTVYCANVANDTVTEYPKGRTSPSVTIKMTSAPEYLAVDASDNLYASTAYGVFEFGAGSTSGTNLGLSVGSAGAIEVDRAGNIILVDDAADTIDIFPAGQTNPSKQVTVGMGAPYSLTLTKSEDRLYVSVNLASGGFEIQELAYPGGTSLKTKLATGAGDWPIAVSPDAVL
jgi:hypothetical protein